MWATHFDYVFGVFQFIDFVRFVGFRGQVKDEGEESEEEEEEESLMERFEEASTVNVTYSTRTRHSALAVALLFHSSIAGALSSCSSALVVYSKPPPDFIFENLEHFEQIVLISFWTF